MGTASLADVAVILPAAGSGLRFSTSQQQQQQQSTKLPNNSSSSSTAITTLNSPDNCSSFACSPKQYIPVGEDHSPLLIHTVDSFSKIPWISQILVLVQDSYLESTKSLIGHYGSRTSMLKTTVAVGAASRHITIRNGVRELEKQLPAPVPAPVPSLVIVHDAVRPFVDEAVCQAVVEEARKHGACGVFAPLVSTILRIDANGFMAEALPRHDLFASEMPQAFSFENLKIAYNSASTDELNNGTECLALVHKYTGCQVKMLPVDPNKYFKVTFEKDLLAVNAMMASERERKGLLHMGPISRNGSSEDFVRDARQAPPSRSTSSSSIPSDYP
ncbi:putative Isoprenoid synthase domain-containing protein [Hypsibius exemplaris]|uniref:Isoprenoid synthase domain-containing protein n=1 Tax=Hypsibius exemplaris TaxID=2072580 RepID=A0A1W0WBH8_HYPEX|nr:putative Isoprenoid synthase domain-containing protein [Hypsibius exemplaris]